MWTEEDIWRALRDCYDPEMALNVVELGRVMEVKLWVDEDAPGAGIAGVRPRQKVGVKLLGGLEGDEGQATLRAVVENRLLGMEGITGSRWECLPNRSGRRQGFRPPDASCWGWMR